MAMNFLGNKENSTYNLYP